MFRGFNLELKLKNDDSFKQLEQVGHKFYEDKYQQVQFSLSTFVTRINSLDGSAIQDSWFPQIDADVFISHSHRDLDTALVLSAWLWENFELTSFVDSCIWRYSFDLQREIDNEHCFIPSRGVYSYELRNHSTSHVHMMLSTALSMMIDKAECLIFLNTPNSLKAYGNTDKTESPWIYSEIATSQIIQKKEPIRRLTEAFSHFEGTDEIKKGLVITHDLDLNHLTKLKFEDLTLWLKNKNNKEHSLDTLYRLLPPIKKGKQFLK